jgi:hypothetical protein
MVLFVDRRRRESRYELVELLRKLVLISILAAISPKSTTFLYTAHVVSFFYFGLFAYTMPSAEPSVARLQFMTLGVTALTIFYGIMLKAPDGGVGSDVDSNERTARVTRPRLYCPWRLPDLLLRVQGMLLAIMNVLVFVLPLYELSQNLRNPATAFRAKATECIRSIRQKLGYQAASPATQGPSETGRGQASSHCKAVVAAEGSHACPCARTAFAMRRSFNHRLPRWSYLATAPPLA